MSKMTLTPKRLFEGVWEALIEGADGPPDLKVTHLDRTLDGLVLKETGEKGQWLLRVPVPASAICDEVQTFLVEVGKTGESLGSFSLIAGDAIGADIRAEMDLLRAELDMLKRAFRRHCVETT